MLYVNSYTNTHTLAHVFESNAFEGLITLYETRELGVSNYCISISSDKECHSSINPGVTYPVEISFTNIEKCKNIVIKLIGKLTNDLTSHADADKRLVDTIRFYSKNFKGDSIESDFRLTDEELKGTQPY